MQARFSRIARRTLVGAFIATHLLNYWPACAQFRYEQTVGVGIGLAAGTSPYTKLVEGRNGALYGTTRFGGTERNGGTLFTINKDGTGFRILHIFGVQPSDGVNPTYAALTLGTNGIFYGVTDRGGLEDRGTIYSINPDGSGYRQIYSFTVTTGRQPRGRLIIGDDGLFVGTTLAGTIFKIDHDGVQFRTINSFATNPPGSGAAYQAGVIKGSDGWLYGTTEDGGDQNLEEHPGHPSATMGTIFRVRQDGSGYQILYRFQGTAAQDGSHPHGALLEGADGALYGMTAWGGQFISPPSGPVEDVGVIFRINRDGSDYSVLFRFGDPIESGGHPYHELVQTADGSLFGVSSTCLFTLQPDGTGFTMVDTNFTTLSVGLLAIPGVMQASDGRFYRPLFVRIIGVNSDGSARQEIGSFRNFIETNEIAPRAALLVFSNKVYGTTEGGGAKSNGTVFSLSTTLSNYTVISMLGTNIPSVAVPNGLAAGTNGHLYGTTQLGGANNAGVIFRLRADGGGYTNLRHFALSGDGRTPRSPLISGWEGRLYGCTFQGGSFQRGTIYRINEDGTGYSTLHNFGEVSPDGQSAQTALTLGPDDKLYGVTFSGGANSRGILFRMGKNGEAYSILHHFDEPGDGSNPLAPLLYATDGYFYGTLVNGRGFLGGIFRIRPDGSDYRVVYKLTDRNRDGNQCRGNLVEAPAGVLWGCTIAGGNYGVGVIFRARLDGTDYRAMWHFGKDSLDGRSPTGGLSFLDNGWVTGTAAEGGDLLKGTIFHFDPSAIILQIQPSSSGVLLKWNSAGGTLQSSTHLPGTTQTWSEYPTSLTITPVETTATIPVESTNRVFRVLVE